MDSRTTNGGLYDDVDNESTNSSISKLKGFFDLSLYPLLTMKRRKICYRIG